MPIKSSDTILGTSRGTAAKAIAFAQAIGSKRLDQVRSYVNEAYALAPRVGIDPAIVVAQSALETNNWRDNHWSEHLNPAGMGVTPNFNFGHGWQSGADAARGQLVHLWLYAKGKPLPSALAPHAGLDPRRDAIPQAHLGQAPTLESLSNKWATEPDYGKRIANRSRDVFPDLPDQAEPDPGNGETQGPFVAPSPIAELEPFRNANPNTAPAMVRSADGTAFIFVADRVKATRPTPRLQRANPNADRVGPDLKVDEKFDGMWIFESGADKELYYVTPFFTRIRVADTARIGDRTGP
jgi:hypothetical protein